jgi:hypothetical protein
MQRPRLNNLRLSMVVILVLTCAVLVIAAGSGFNPPTSYPVQQGPTGVAVADFSGDRKVDLVVPNVETGSISVFLGKGDGTFLAANNYPLIDDSGTPEGSPAVVAAQFTRKRIMDVAVVNSNRNTVDILLGNGKGGFTKGNTFHLPDFPFAIVAGDFNHDGNKDLAVTSVSSFNYASPGKVSVFLGNGDGTFQQPIVTSTGVNLYSIDAGDFDGDGKLDVVVTTIDVNNPRRVQVLFGLGNGGFRPPLNLDAGASPWAVRVGRFDKTKHLGFAVLGQFSGVTIFTGDGHGKFTAWTSPWPQAAIQTPMTFEELRKQGKTADTVHSLAVADFDKNGIDDVAVGNPPGYVQVMLGNGTGGLNPPTNYALGNTAPGGLSNWELVAADLNRDKYPDLVSTNITASPTAHFIAVAINQR